MREPVGAQGPGAGGWDRAAVRPGRRQGGKDPQRSLTSMNASAGKWGAEAGARMPKVGDGKPEPEELEWV